jgi:hypothetical protein
MLHFCQQSSGAGTEGHLRPRYKVTLSYPKLKEYGDDRCVFFIDTFVSLAIPSLQLRLATSLFSNLDSKLKTNTQYLSIDQCRVLVLICSHIL